MSRFVIPIENLTAYNSIPRNRQLQHTITNHCERPWRDLVVDWKGDCFVCSCEAWLPITVGRITDFERLEDVWTSPTARALQQTITDRTYAECAVDRCGILTNGIPAPQNTVSINIDESCNLACPSCRRDLINITDGPVYESKLVWVRHLVGLLEASTAPARIVMSGNGDPLASAILRPLLHQFRPRPNQRIRLYTNALLLEKQLANNPVLDSIDQYFISVDAGTAEVYQQVRRPGRWSTLLRNLDYLKSINPPEVLLMFVLQRSNYTDMENFIELCHRYGFRGWINRVEDWGTWGAEFSQHNVIGNPQHPEHESAVRALQQAVHRYYSEQIRFESSLVALATATDQAN